jgi:hypothetical protein
VRLPVVRIFLPLLALLALLTACADNGAADGSGADGTAAERTSGPGTDSGAGGGTSQAENDLTIEVDPGDGSEPESWTLTCVGSADGNHPDAEAACAHLEGLEEPFAPLPEDVICTEQFDGPQTAHITGVWGGEPVDLELSRTDGCRIAQWDALVPLLPS